MNEEDFAFQGQFLLLATLTRTLVANGTVSKLDLLAELSRIQLAFHDQAVRQVQELIGNLPDQ